MRSKVVQRILSDSRKLVDTGLAQITRTEFDTDELVSFDDVRHFIKQMDEEGDVIRGGYFGCGMYGPSLEEVYAFSVDFHTRKRNRIDIARRIGKTDSNYRRKRRYGSRCHKEKREPEREKRRQGFKRKYCFI